MSKYVLTNTLSPVANEIFGLGKCKATKKYLLVTILAPLEDEYGSGETKNWFDGLPRSTIYVADVVEEKTDIKSMCECAGAAINRSLKDGGFPKHSAIDLTTTDSWSLMQSDGSPVIGPVEKAAPPKPREGQGGP